MALVRGGCATYLVVTSIPSLGRYIKLSYDVNASRRPEDLSQTAAANCTMVKDRFAAHENP